MIFLPFDVPVDPDRPEARRLLEEELAKAEYLRAKPNWFDQLVGDIIDWFLHLGDGASNGGGPPGIGLLVGLVVIVALVVISFLVFGLPRINRRSAVTGSLFGEDDARTAAQMRLAAEAAASAGDYTTAIAEMFRSIARGLAERTVLSTSPGTTAHDFATRAGGAFPARADALAEASAAFDGVRYLGLEGTAEHYRDVARLEGQSRAAKPAALEAVHE